MMGKFKNRIHNHPMMEKKLGLDDDHVIIDRELFEELKYKQHGNCRFINVRESE
jgi:hypothetical protein